MKPAEFWKLVEATETDVFKIAALAPAKIAGVAAYNSELHQALVCAHNALAACARIARSLNEDKG
jgi:hypothetical protein